MNVISEFTKKRLTLGLTKIQIQIQIKMSENSSDQLGVGSIIHMDDAIPMNDTWITQGIQFEDIYLTESEDFWQEQILDCDKLLDMLVLDGSPASEGILFKQSTSCEALSPSEQTSTVPFEEVSVKGASTREHSSWIAEKSFGEELQFGVATDKLMLSKEMCEIEVYDLPVSVTGMSIEQTIASEFSDETNYEIEMTEQSASLTDMHENAFQEVKKR